jgi:hypothetical protein
MGLLFHFNEALFTTVRIKQLWFKKQFHIMLEWTDGQLVDYSISGNKRIKN